MDNKERDWETEAYLAKIRKTISESERMVEQARLRMQETDRMLESQGLTREQVMNFHFTEMQREAANAELRRRGLEPVDWEEMDRAQFESGRYGAGDAGSGSPAQPDAKLAERQRKFGMMMKPFQI